ncbi:MULTISPECIES: multicopper oxidase family protein [Thioalkalivibrio]|uniref:multicopper oxidase family protein n=1 Tax=Thioalkalivibrio TaxID=106633 RepID=UPI000369E9DA|nr:MULTISPECIES: copper oxidase [Thioalkalivibrio]
MKRRNFLLAAGAAMLPATTLTRVMAETGHEHHNEGETTPGERTDQGYMPVHTPNGWTLPYEMNNGVKEFHLVAEEIEHEFAPGSVARCWGYNGTTPGPTIEAVEGDKVRIYVTNRLPEYTSVHWHGIHLPSGMDGVKGVTQPPIHPGETFVYEFELNQHGTHMYHPHADEMVQMAMGMMGMFIIHPKDGEIEPVDRDYAILLHNWALHPGTRTPDPSIMVDFDLWSMNSKVFPAIDSLVAKTGERVRIRMGNLSMWNHPMHVHGVSFEVTGSDGGRWPREQWRKETTEIVAVGQTRDIEFIAPPGDWAFHCHMTHHTMNPMGHGIANTLGVDQSGLEEEIRTLLPGYMAMGEHGMADHQDHTDAGHMPGPENTLPMGMGHGPFGNIGMGGMFTLVKVRDDQEPGDFSDPGWYWHPEGEVAWRVSSDPDFGNPVRRGKVADADSDGLPTPSRDAHGHHGHGGHGGHNGHEGHNH